MWILHPGLSFNLTSLSVQAKVGQRDSCHVRTWCLLTLDPSCSQGHFQGESLRNDPSFQPWEWDFFFFSLYTVFYYMCILSRTYTTINKATTKNAILVLKPILESQTPPQPVSLRFSHRPSLRCPCPFLFCTSPGGVLLFLALLTKPPQPIGCLFLGDLFIREILFF